MSDFVHLHLHTQYSLLDGALKISDLFEKAHQYKMPAVAMTDHGNMFGAIDFYFSAQKYNIKPIIGSEIYVASKSRFDRKDGEEDKSGNDHAFSKKKNNFHLTLLCMNMEGYKNLCQIVTKAYLEGFYYKPRADKEILKQYSEGIIVLSGCLAAEIPQLIVRGELDKAKESILWYSQVFKDRYYLEIQENGIPEQRKVNDFLLQFSEELKIPVVASNDAHYLKREDSFAQECLLCINSQTTLKDEKRFKISTDELFFKSGTEMKNQFQYAPHAVENTLAIAERCNLKFQFQDEKGRQIYHLPEFVPPEKESVNDFINRMANDGLAERFQELKESNLEVQNKEAYQERLQMELKVITEMGFASYFLIVSDFIQYAKNRDIPVGPGRGSGAGSLVAYSLKITDLDPIRHGLLFERFLNPERISMPDFDIDFCMERRGEVIQYVTQKYSKENVAQIITYGKLLAKGVIRDVGRVMGIPYIEVDKLAKLIPDTPGKTYSINEALELEPRLKEEATNRLEMKELIRIAKILEGLNRHASVHAAGVIISNRPLVEYLPLAKSKDNEIITQFDMIDCEKIGLVKFDFLGLKTLTLIQKIEKLIRAVKDPQFKISRAPIYHPDVFTKVLQTGSTVGVFQFESPGMQSLLKKLKPDSFEDITAVTALYRPGPLGSGMLDEFINRKHGKTPIEYELPQLEPILKETYGVILYQEQVQKIAVVLANYTLGSADILRKAMGKKKPEEMAKQKEIFLKGAMDNGIKKEVANDIFDKMEKFAGYGFNKSHAAAYAVISLQTAYLKAFYPVEFFAALLSIEMEDTDKLSKTIADAKNHDIQISPPSVSESNFDFTVKDEKNILFGLGAVKNLGTTAVENIIEVRNQIGAFKDIFHFCEEVNLRKVNKKSLEALIYSGSFDQFKYHRSQLMAVVEKALSLGASFQASRLSGQKSFFDSGIVQNPSTTVSMIPKMDEWDSAFKLAMEKESIGYYVSGHPLLKHERLIKLTRSSSIADMPTYQDGATVTLAVLISEIKERVTKNNEKMAIFTIEDLEERTEAIAFPDFYLENKDKLVTNMAYLIKGTLDLNSEKPKLKLSKKGGATLQKIEEIKLKTAVHLYFKEEKLEPEKIQKMKEILALNQGDSKTFLHIKKSGSTTSLELPNHLWVKVSDLLMNDFEKEFGRESIAVRLTQ